MDAQGPASSILLGDYKLTRTYESGERKLFDLEKDVAERNDLAKQMPQKVSELDQRLTDYLKAVNAQLPTFNPNFDPSKAAGTLPGEQREGKGGKGGKRKGERQKTQSQTKQP